MTSKWEVFSNVFSGKNVYRVGRVKNINEVLHSGNIEYYHDDNIENGWTESIAEAEDIAIKLNEEGKE